MVVMVVFVAGSSSDDGPDKEGGFSPERRRELNGLVNKYLTAVEGLRHKPEFKEEADAMDTVKMLMIQSWIYMLTPETNMLKEFVTVEEGDDLETIKERIVDDLREKDKQTSVSDTILHYVTSVKPKVHEAFNKRMDSLKDTIKEANEKEAKETDEKKKKELMANLEKIGEELEDALFFMEFSNVATRMAMQSYVFDFVNSFEVTSVDGKETMEFDMPPLYPNSFEDLMEAEEYDDYDETDDKFEEEERKEGEETLKRVKRN